MPPPFPPFPAGRRLPGAVFLPASAPWLAASLGLLLAGCAGLAVPEPEPTPAPAAPPAAPAPVSQHVPPGYAYFWGDTFDQPAIDPDKWVVGSLRDPRNGDLVPGAAGDHLLNRDYLGYVTPEDSFIEDGALVLLNQRRDVRGTSPEGVFHYTSGWVMSLNRAAFNKGYIEVRARFPAGDRVWPAIWLIPQRLNWGPEWDIWEYFGHRKDVGLDNMGLHLMTGNYARPHWNYHWLKNFHRDYDGGAWHVYGFEWVEDEARWWIDGRLVHTLRRADTKQPERWPDEPMYLVLNNGVRRLSSENATTYPNRLVIDYLEVYTRTAPPAPPAGP